MNLLHRGSLALVIVACIEGCNSGSLGAALVPNVDAAVGPDLMVSDGASVDLSSVDMNQVDSESIDAGENTDASENNDAMVSGGCGITHMGSATTESITVDGLTREYALYVPNGYDASTPARVVIGFHGSGSTGPDFRGWVGAQLEAHAGSSAIFVYPTGTVIDGRTTWATGRGGVDVALVQAILAHLQGEYCVDLDRVFAFGFSAGGGMAHALGCYQTTSVRAIAVGSGWWGFGGCEGPVPAWIFHASNDTTNDYTTWGLPGRDHWTAANGCSTSATVPHSPSPCVQYEGCSSDPVVWCTNATDGHTWPAWMSSGVWDFFAGF